MQQMRPLAEVLGGGNFFFLQESELDSPDVNAVANGSPANMHTNLHTNLHTNVVFANMKPQVDIAQQAVNQIPGFATPNAPIPIPIVQPTPLAMASPLQQQPQPPQPTNCATNPAQIIVQQQFPDATKFINASTIPISKIQSSEVVGVVSDLRSNIITLQPADIVVEQRVPEINEWKPEEATAPSKPAKHHSASKELVDCTNGNSTWHDPYTTSKSNSQESNEWNGGGNGNNANEPGQDESNTWTSGGGNGAGSGTGGGGGSGQRYQFRHGSGSYGRNNRSSGNAGRNNSATGNSTNGYRSRPNSNGSNTFYRNNDPYYQNQNGGSRGSDQKSENYGRSNGYRGRDSRGENNGTGSSSSSYKPLPQRNNNQNATNDSNRLNGSGNHRNAGNPSNTGRNPLSAHQSTGINA